MSYRIHSLELHKTITPGTDSPASDGTFAILAFSSLVEKGNLEPKTEDHLAGGETATEIPSGYYLFAQGTCGAEEGSDLFAPELKSLYRQAAEEVWLESLWREKAFADSRVFVRLLREDGKTAFQIFRKVLPGDNDVQL